MSNINTLQEEAERQERNRLAALLQQQKQQIAEILKKKAEVVNKLRSAQAANAELAQKLAVEEIKVDRTKKRTPQRLLLSSSHHGYRCKRYRTCN